MYNQTKFHLIRLLSMIYSESRNQNLDCIPLMLSSDSEMNWHKIIHKSKTNLPELNSKSLEFLL
jgi:hypothetical protein